MNVSLEHPAVGAPEGPPVSPAEHDSAGAVEALESDLFVTTGTLTGIGRLTDVDDYLPERGRDGGQLDPEAGLTTRVLRTASRRDY